MDSKNISKPTPNSVSLQPKSSQQQPNPIQQQPKPIQQQPNPIQQQPKPIQQQPNPIQQQPNPIQQQPKPVQQQSRQSQQQRISIQQQSRQSQQQRISIQQQSKQSQQQSKPIQQHQSQQQSKPIQQHQSQQQSKPIQQHQNQQPSKSSEHDTKSLEDQHKPVTNEKDQNQLDKKESLTFYENIARMIKLYAKSKQDLPKPELYRAESMYRGLQGPPGKRPLNKTLAGTSFRKIMPAPPKYLSKKETIRTPVSKLKNPTTTSVGTRPVYPSSFRPPAAPPSRSAPVARPIQQVPAVTTRKPLMHKVVVVGVPQRANQRRWRKKATHKKSEEIEKSQDKSDVAEVNPELQLLEDVDAGKVQEGFTAESFQREKSRFVSRILRNTGPIRILLKLTGRFPFTETRNGDGTITYEASMYRPQGIYFVVVSVLVTYLLFVGCFNLMDVMLNVTFGDGQDRFEECEDERMYEVTVVDRNIVGFAGLWTALCHATLTSVNLFYKRHYMAQYLSFWSVAAQTMHVDVAIGIFKYSMTMVVFYVLTMAVLTLLSVFRVSATMSGLPSLFSVLMFRMAFPCILQRNTLIQRKEQPSFEFTETHYIFEIISGVFLVFIYILSKMLIIFFLHFCRMLVMAFKSWNARFHAVMNYPHKFVQSVEGRTTYDLLFKDHCTLLSLIEGTDRCFSTIVESYLALQLVSIILETYSVYRNIILKLGKEQMTHVNQTITNHFQDGPFYTRTWDFIPGFIILLSNVIVLVVILKEAGRVSDTAKEGLEVIRKKTMMGRKSDQELWFTLSMYFSYSSQVQLSLKGSGFFEFDNAFVLTVLAVIFSNLITTLQFAPSLDPDYRDAKYSYQNYTNDDNRENIGAFIRDLENLHDRHWIVVEDIFQTTSNAQNVLGQFTLVLAGSHVGLLMGTLAYYPKCIHTLFFC